MKCTHGLIFKWLTELWCILGLLFVLCGAHFKDVGPKRTSDAGPVCSYMMSSHEAMNTGYSCWLRRAHGPDAMRQNCVCAPDNNVHMVSKKWRPYVSQRRLQRFLTGKQAHLMIPAGTSCLMRRRAAFSRDHLWIFSVWLLIRSSQGLCFETRMFLAIFG